MYRTSLSLLAALSFVPSSISAPTASSATLLAAHYTGKLYTLSFTSTGSTGSLTVGSPVTGCGNTPAWLELYPADKTLYCFDESWTGSGSNAAYSVGSDGKLTLKSSARTSGNSVHGVLYGGSDGKGFAATVE
jgi:6-phosphogluconolactonase (cycloisomerase 2 family)